MSTVHKALFASLLGCLAFNANAADELLVTGGAAKGGSALVALDMATDGQSRGFQAVLTLPKGAKADTSKCLSALPAGFQGVCKQNGSEVRMMAFAFDNRTLPAGVVSIGTIALSGAGEAKLAVTNFEAVDASGAERTVSSTVTMDNGGRAATNNNRNQQVR